MDGPVKEKQKSFKPTPIPSVHHIEDLNPTTLIDIEFYKSYGLWDEEVSRKYAEVVKKWEKIKELTDADQKQFSRIHIKD